MLPPSKSGLIWQLKLSKLNIILMRTCLLSHLFSKARRVPLLHLLLWRYVMRVEYGQDAHQLLSVRLGSRSVGCLPGGKAQTEDSLQARLWAERISSQDSRWSSLTVMEFSIDCSHSLSQRVGPLISSCSWRTFTRFLFTWIPLISSFEWIMCWWKLSWL